MNCSYRILKNVNIGQRVRKTADKSTVKFDNEPFSDAVITKYWNQGFLITHPNLPKEIWVDFDQLPLTKLTIDKGVIKNEITFVERLMGGGGTTSMFLMPTDWLDYQELLHDKRLKDDAVKYKVSDLKAGENVISALCREGNVMTYLGRFFSVHTEQVQRYGYRDKRHYPYIKTCPERAWFAIDKGDGKYKLVNYPLTNKIVLELYKAEDRGLPGTVENFIVPETNLDMIRFINHNSRGESYFWGYEWKDYDTVTRYDFIKGGSDRALYITDTKKDWRVNALEFANEHLKLVEAVFETYDLASAEYNRRRY